MFACLFVKLETYGSFAIIVVAISLVVTMDSILVKDDQMKIEILSLFSPNAIGKFLIADFKCMANINMNRKT